MTVEYPAFSACRCRNRRCCRRVHLRRVGQNKLCPPLLGSDGESEFCISAMSFSEQEDHLSIGVQIHVPSTIFESSADNVLDDVTEVEIQAVSVDEVNSFDAARRVIAWVQAIIHGVTPFILVKSPPQLFTKKFIHDKGT